MLSRINKRLEREELIDTFYWYAKRSPSVVVARAGTQCLYGSDFRQLKRRIVSQTIMDIYCYILCRDTTTFAISVKVFADFSRGGHDPVRSWICQTSLETHSDIIVPVLMNKGWNLIAINIDERQALYHCFGANVDNGELQLQTALCLVANAMANRDLQHDFMCYNLQVIEYNDCQEKNSGLHVCNRIRSIVYNKHPQPLDIDQVRDDIICSLMHEIGFTSDRWCCCNGKVASGALMIACDNPYCGQGQWFHAQCVDAEEVPKGSWFCSECSKSM